MNRRWSPTIASRRMHTISQDRWTLPYAHILSWRKTLNTVFLVTTVKTDCDKAASCSQESKYRAWHRRGVCEIPTCWGAWLLNDAAATGRGLATERTHRPRRGRPGRAGLRRGESCLPGTHPQRKLFNGPQVESVTLYKTKFLFFRCDPLACPFGRLSPVTHRTEQTSNAHLREQPASCVTAERKRHFSPDQSVLGGF